jgi:peptide chain release factor subunit 1
VITVADFTDGQIELKEILNFIPTGELIISIYLPVDSSKLSRQDYITQLNSMIGQSRENLEKDENLNRNQKKNLLDLFEKIKKYVNEVFRPESAKTLLIYAGEKGFWEEIRLPVVLKPRLVIDPKPHTQVLRNLLQNYKRYGILLIDKEKAQIYSMHLGEIKEYLAAFISDVPPKVNYRSQLAFKEKNILSRIEEKLHHFFKLANDRTFELFRDGKFDSLILAGRKEILSQFKNYLHSYLQQKYIGDIHAEPDTSITIIKEKAQKIITESENKYKNELINKLIDEYNPNGWSVLGIEATISALIREQVRIVVYDINFKTDGYICNACNYMTVRPIEECPYCKGKLVYYNDITDEIVENAVNQGCEIVDVDGNEGLIQAGSIGAVLRYKL